MSQQLFLALNTALEDWSTMQKTSGDEGADAAERFEKNFYEFIEELRSWYHKLENKPETIEEAEELNQVQEIIEKLPGPLQLNFLNELELIVENEEQVRFD